MSGRLYDKDPQNIIVAETTGGLSVVGTAANDTELIRIPITRPIKVENIRMVAMTGGTADGPVVGIAKSLDGTGALADIATQNVGTSADKTGFELTVTATDLAAGDHLASTPSVTLNVEFRPDFD